MAKQLGFYFNANACTDCKACMSACKDKNDLPVGINYRRVYKVVGGHWLPHPEDRSLFTPSRVFSYAISISCNHCQNALCADVCPAGAIQRNEDGLVLIDGEACIGCRYCEWACPYGGPQFNEELGVMTKCDFCVDLLQKGQNPVCVDACPMRALDFGDVEELRAKYGDVDGIAPLPAGDITSPCMVITPHRDAPLSNSDVRVITSMTEGA